MLPRMSTAPMVRIRMWDKIKSNGPLISATAIVVIVGIALFNWANNLTGDVARLGSQVNALDQDVVELRQDMSELRQDMNTRFDRLEAEVRVSQQEIIAVIQGHEHDDTGRVFFRTPP